MKQVRSLLSNRNYKEAEKAGWKALESTNIDHRRETIFLLALVLAHPDNPERDPVLARRYLGMLASEQDGWIPSSEFLALDALLIAVEREIQAAGVIEEARRELENRRSEYDKALGEIADARKQLQESKKKIEKMEQLLDQFKRIDLDVEEKKRETLHPAPTELEKGKKTRE